MRRVVNIYKKNKRFLSGIHASLADQVLLSLINFAVGMIFIRYASKHEYAIYSQVYALVFLTSIMQNALINSPALTLLPQEMPINRGRLAGSFFVLQAVLSLGIAFVFAVLINYFPHFMSFDSSTVWLVAATSLTIWIVWLRDFVRNQLFVGLRVIDCLKLDFFYFLLNCIVFMGLILNGHVSAVFILISMGLVGIATTVPWLLKADITFHVKQTEIINTLEKSWKLAKWSLPGGLVSWAFGNGYVLIAAYTIGSAGTADIVAARLFVAPLGMVYLAWSNIFRPRASHWIAEGRAKTVTLVSYAALGVIVLGVVVYVGVLVLAYPFLESHMLGQKYNGLTTDIAWWAGFFLASGIANIGTGVLHALGRYKESFFASAAGCVVSIPLMFILGESQGKVGILLSLTIGEMVTAAWLMVAMNVGLRHLTHSKVSL